MPVWVLTEGADNFPSGGPPPPDDWKNIGSDQIFGLGGDDIIHAGAMIDTVSAGDGDDEVHGGDDGDILLGGDDNDELNGDDGDDSLSGENGADILHGNIGIDSISGGAGGDMIFGDEGADIINGDQGGDIIEGGIGDDTIYTGAGSDIAHGGANNDTFGSVVDSALAGDVDLLFGDAGNDLLIAKGNPADGWTASFDGGANTDTVRAGNDIRHYTFSNVEVLQATQLVVATAAQFNQFSLFTDINGFSDVTVFNITTAGTVDFSARLDASVIKLAVTGSIDGDTIIGGAGDDLLRGFVFPIGEVPGPASVHLEGRGGNDNLQGSGGDDYLDGGAGADAMIGFDGHNIYIVDHIGDTVGAGGAGVDEVRTSLNSYDSSVLFGGHLIDKIVFTGAGNFTGVLRASGGTMVGGAGHDTLTGFSGGIFDGNQTFIGGRGNDTITGANSNPDTANYSTAATGVTVSLLIAGAQNTGASTGSDTLSGIENLTGSNLVDTLTGDGGGNVLTGLGGADTLIGGAGGDTLNGGAGSDTASYAGATARVKLAMDGSFAAEGDALGDTLISIAKLTGTSISDVLRGDANANTMRGGSGSDTIQGMAGNDNLYGETGSDALTGGLGNDFFSYSGLTHGGDTIKDFSNVAGNDDALRFTGSVFGGLPVGVLAANRFRANTTGLAGDADDRFIYETDTGILRYDANGNAGGGVTVIATLTGAPLISAADILII